MYQIISTYNLNDMKLVQFYIDREFVFSPPRTKCWPNQYNTTVLNVKLSIKVSLNTAITVTTNPCLHTIR